MTRPAGVIPGGLGSSEFVVAAGAAAATEGAAVPTAATEVLQFGDSFAALRCRQATASGPPGCTPEQFVMKSRWQVLFIALCCAAVGVAIAVVAAGLAAGRGALDLLTLAGGRLACVAAGTGFATAGGVSAAAGAGGAAVTRGTGAGAAAVAGADAACAGFAWAGAADGIVALTAVLQPGERFSTFFCKQASASLPPGVTPEHFDVKSERQFDRTALCCSEVVCAPAEEAKARCSAASNAIKTMLLEAIE